MNYPEATLPQLLEQAATKWPDATALVYFGTKISYRQLKEQADRFAAALQALGVKKGDRVALMLPNCPQFVISYFGTLRAGAIVTATSTMYTAREVTHQWNDAGVKVVVADRRLLSVIKAAIPQLIRSPQIILTGLREYYPRHFHRLCALLDSSRKKKSVKVSKAAERGRAIHRWGDLLGVSRAPGLDDRTPLDIACLQYTGGTTGISKGAMLTHSNLTINARQVSDWLKLGRNGTEVTVAALPLFHIYATTCVMISSVLEGGSVVILPRFELHAALNLIRKHRPTIFFGVPTMYVAFNSAPTLNITD